MLPAREVNLPGSGSVMALESGSQQQKRGGKVGDRR